MYVYAINPIDCWSGWFPLDEFIKRSDKYDYFLMEDVYADLSTAMKIAREQHGWEGDVRAGPYIAALPTQESGCPEILIAWKQDNNGQTFVASQRKLPWLDDDLGQSFKPIDFIVLSQSRK